MLPLTSVQATSRAVIARPQANLVTGIHVQSGDRVGIHRREAVGRLVTPAGPVLALKRPIDAIIESGLPRLRSSANRKRRWDRRSARLRRFLADRRMELSVSVGGISVSVGGTSVSVGGTSVSVGGISVSVGGTSVSVGGISVSVGGTIGVRRRNICIGWRAGRRDFCSVRNLSVCGGRSPCPSAVARVGCVVGRCVSRRIWRRAGRRQCRRVRRPASLNFLRLVRIRRRNRRCPLAYLSRCWLRVGRRDRCVGCRAGRCVGRRRFNFLLLRNQRHHIGPDLLRPGSRAPIKASPHHDLVALAHFQAGNGIGCGSDGKALKFRSVQVR